MTTVVDQRPATLEDGELEQPAATAGSLTSPQQLVGTLLGDYWLHDPGHLPSAALVDLLEDFGVTDSGARAALSRLRRRDFLVASKLGRRTFYGLSEQGRERVIAGAQRISSFHADQEWRGSWCGVVFSIPEEQKDKRHLLRSRLRWLNFAPLYDGFWISPHASVSSVIAVLDKIDLRDSATVFLTANEDLYSRGRPPVEAWNLTEVRARYERFIAAAEQVLDEAAHGDMTLVRALTARVCLMHDFHEFQALDPRLPTALMPPDWPRARAQQLIGRTYDALGPLAHLRVATVVGRYDEGLAEKVTWRDWEHFVEESPTR